MSRKTHNITPAKDRRIMKVTTIAALGLGLLLGSAVWVTFSMLAFVLDIARGIGAA